MKVIMFQELASVTFNHLTRLATLLASVGPLKYCLDVYHHRRETDIKWDAFYGHQKEDDRRTLSVSLSRSGCCFGNTFMMSMHFYHQLGGRLPKDVPWLTMALALMDAIMRRYKVINHYFEVGLRKPPDLLLRTGPAVIHGGKQVYHKPFHCMGHVLLGLVQLSTALQVCQAALQMNEPICKNLVKESKFRWHKKPSSGTIKRVVPKDKMPCLELQDDPICVRNFGFDPSWVNNESFCDVVGLGESPLCMPCVYTPDSPECAAMVSSATPLAVDENILLYFDSGASHMSTPFETDFVKLDKSMSSGKLDGIASGLEIKGTGTVKYVLQDDKGKEIVIKLQAYWVPALKCRLVSPQDLRTEDGNPVTYQSHPGYMGEERFAELMVKPKKRGYSHMEPLQTLTMQFDKHNNLPIHRAHLPGATEHTAKALQSAICETSVHNQNLDNAQKELLYWHFRLGHIGFGHLQFLARTGKLPVKNPKAFANCDHPKCAACQFGKACHHPNQTKKEVKNPSKEMELKKNDLHPGQKVSVDHFQSALPGRLYSSRGRMDSKDMYHGGSIFVDHASGYIQVHHQVSLSADETIKAKLMYE